MGNEKLKKVGIFAAGVAVGRWSVPSQYSRDRDAVVGAMDRHMDRYLERVRMRKEIIHADRTTGPIWRRAFFYAWYVFFNPKVPPSA